ncbi:MAG: hypothetical protein Q8Q10_02550 [bacterium]|nr:hypothetical protein [bacterium]
MTTYRKKSQEEQRWRQRLSRSLQASQKLYHRCLKEKDALLKKVTGYEKSIVSQAATIARQEDIIAVSAKTIVEQEKILDRYDQQIKTLGASLAKVHQNGSKEIEESRGQNEQLQMTVASHEETIGNLRLIVASLRSRMRWGD